MTIVAGPIALAIDNLYELARPSKSQDPDRSAQQRADDAEDIYMPIGPQQGRLVYSLVRATRPEVVVEFGMSYGISTLFSAAAVRANGTGHVYTTELSAKKIAAARQTFEAAGVSDIVTILEGDALETLKSVPGPIGFVLLDGWKEMYLPVLKLLEPQLSSGALLFADNVDMPETSPYLDYVLDQKNGYTVARTNDWTALACRD